MSPRPPQDPAFLERWNESTLMGVNYLESSQRWMASLGLLDKETGLILPGKRARCCMLWELRNVMAESVALVQLLPHLIDAFAADKNESQQKAGLEATHTEFLAVFCRVVGLSKCPPAEEGGVPMHEFSYHTKRKEEFDKWTAVIATTQAAVKVSGVDVGMRECGRA